MRGDTLYLSDLDGTLLRSDQKTSGYTNAVRAASGMFHMGIAPMVIPAVAGAFLGFWVGGFLFQKLDGEKLKKLVYIVVAASGLWIFVGDLLGFSV